MSAPASPPPFPVVNPYTPPTVDSGPSPATEHEIVRMVMSGQRMVIFPYVFSIVVMTFRRNMGGAVVVKDREWPVGKLFSATLITALFGWWGIPFGII